MQVVLSDVEGKRTCCQDLRKYQLRVSGVVADVLVESIQNLFARVSRVRQHPHALQQRGRGLIRVPRRSGRWEKRLGLGNGR